MSKQQPAQRKIIQINHALSGVHGPELKHKAVRITDVRKQIIRRLERKKKHSAILHDQLYQYLEKFPEQVSNIQMKKNNLQKQVLKAKKNTYFDQEDKQIFNLPTLQYTCQTDSLIKVERMALERLTDFLKIGSIDI